MYDLNVTLNEEVMSTGGELKYQWKNNHINRKISGHFLIDGSMGSLWEWQLWGWLSLGLLVPAIKESYVLCLELREFPD